MDSLTQIVLGAAVGEAALGKKVGNKAPLWGAIAGTIPDLDVISRFFVDQITALEYHRGFSHSLLFSILFAPALGWIIHSVHKKANASWKEWSKLAFLSLVTHPMLDCHTSYGTQFLWPLDLRIAYNNIFVADPFYTVPFLIAVLVVLFLNRENKWRSRINWFGIGISSFYMILTLMFKYVTFQKFENSLKAQNINYKQISTLPTPLNSFLWSARVETEEEFLFGMYSIFDKDDNISFVKVNKNHELSLPFREEEIFKKLIHFSKEWYVLYKEGDKTYIADTRFGHAENDNITDGFVYSFELKFDKNGNFFAINKPKDFINAKEMLGKVFDRIFTKP